MFKQSKLVSALAVAGIALFGAHAAQAQVIKIDGSSTVYPITEAVAEEFQKAKKNAIKVTVGISGTGGGFKKFCRDETDLSNASRPITKSEMEACKAAGVEYIEMPVAFDALTVVVNPKNAFLKQATVEEMKMLWEPAAQGKIMKWNQVNPAWPDAPVKLFGAGADSGTFEYFTEAMVGKAKSLQKPEVQEFIDFYMKNGAKLTKEVKYVPLPASAYTGNLEHVKKKKLGTVFGGHNEIGITIEELMKREAKM